MNPSAIPSISGQRIGGGTPGVMPKGSPSAWLDYGTVTVPDSHAMVLWWAQYLWTMDGTFRSAMERVAAHFMTQVELPDLEPDEESQWKDLFQERINYRSDMLSLAHEYLAYGNCFASLFFPFRRYVRCQKCFLDQPIREVDFRLEFTHVEPYLKWNRQGKCPRCGDTHPYEVVDRRDPDLDRLRIVRYCPEDMDLAQNRWSGQKEFWYKIPAEERREIQNSVRIHVETTPLEVLQAVAVNGMLRFTEDEMFHAGESTLTGIRANGWGVPRSVASFRAAWLQQLVNKTDQAVALDYTLGMRVLSPTPTPGGMDPMQTAGMETFAARVQNIVQKHRDAPTSYHTSPYPLQYQFMGGEGANLIPPEKLKFRQQEFLNQLGVPLEYQNMSLTTQGAPMALRLFESYWQGVPSLYNNILNWIVTSVSKAYNLPGTKARMQRSTLADDADYRQIVLQLMSANQLSPQTALQAYNIDAYQEAQKAIKHQALVAKLQAEFDEKAMAQQELGALKGMATNPTPSMLAQQAQGGAGAPPPPGVPMGGAPMGGMPGAQQQSPQSLSGISDQASQIAQQLVSMPEYDRKQQLKALRESNKDMHSLVMGFMEEYRRQAASQGQQMVLQQGAPQ